MDDDDNNAVGPANVRSAAQSSSQHNKLFRRWAAQVARGGGGINRVWDGYLVRANKVGRGGVARVIDVPAMLMRINAFQVDGWLPAACTPAGPRDDFLVTNNPPTTTYTTTQETAQMIPPPALKLAVTGSYPFNVYTQPQINRGEFTVARRLYPLVSAYGGSSFYTALDDVEFTFSHQVQIGVKRATAPSCLVGNSSSYQPNANFLARSQFAVAEEDLPDNWTFHPRRLLASSNTLQADLRAAYTQYSFNYGHCCIPAEGEATIDRYCLAVEVYQQRRDTWNDGDFDYYDRGHSGFAIIQGTVDSADYDGDLMYGEVTDVSILLATELPAYLQPYVATYDVGGVTLDRTGKFYDPLVLRCTEGFATFCPYAVTFSDGSGTSSSQNMRSLLVINPAKEVTVLRADMIGLDGNPSQERVVWPLASDETGATVTETIDYPGFDASAAANATMIGGFTVTEQSNGATVYAAYALVWEHDDSPAAEQESTGFDLYLSNNGNSKWALYRYESKSPTRVLLSEETPLASITAALLTRAFGYPFNGDPYRYWSPLITDYARYHRVANFVYLGNGKAAVVAVDKPFGMQQPTIGAVQQDDPPRLEAHDVYLAEIDLKAGTIRKRGAIVNRTHSYVTFSLSLLQPYFPASGEVAEVPAVILAAQHNLSELVETPEAAKVYISRDGGDTWTVYVENPDGASYSANSGYGAYAIGNALYGLDPSKSFLTGASS
ncbi:hypothetical protein [Pseudomonas typographi]|uniref:hypothetical protein n=1 Tax=Pseudomonas typographi TaxID=2715964 RepID=UPI0016884D17|nr:hypothetical protein [Pseudomonas typographi]MBD1554764.1 hypothetical protein [Pseudomonas typographi]